MTRLERLRAEGVSIWLDTLSRDLLESGRFERLGRERGVTGASSNPTIFAKAIGGSDRYAAQLASLLEAGLEDPREQFLELALEDVRRAARTMDGVHRRSGGNDGFVSLEVTPDLAYDGATTVAQATDLWRRLAAPNVMIKVPATEPGVAAIGELTAVGVNVNVNAQAAYETYRAAFADERWQTLLALGAAPQRPLWASTAPKDPSYRDVVYLERLALPGSILTVPESILNAFADHGVPRPAVVAPEWERELEAIASAVDVGAIAAELEQEGVAAFCGSYRELLASIERRAAQLQPAPAG